MKQCQVNSPIGNESDKSISNIFLLKNSGNNFIFLPAFYLIMWVMKASKNFGKTAILKI